MARPTLRFLELVAWAQRTFPSHSRRAWQASGALQDNTGAVAKLSDWSGAVASLAH